MGRIPIVSKKESFEIQQLVEIYEANKVDNIDKCKTVVDEMEEYCKANEKQISYFTYKFYEADYYFLNNDYETAYICGLEGINHFEVCDQSYSYVRLINFLGTLSSLRGEDILALQYYLDAIEICKEINLLGFRGIIFNNLGCLYNDVKDYDTALRYYKMCINYNQDDEKGISRKFISFLNCAIDAARLKRIEEAKIYLHSAKLAYDTSFGIGQMTSFICVETIIAFNEENQEKYEKNIIHIYDLLCEDKISVGGISELIDLIDIEIGFDIKLAEKLLTELVRLEKKFKVEQYAIDIAQLWIDIAKAKKDNNFIFRALENYSELTRKKVEHDNLVKRNNLNSKIKLHETLIKNKYIQEQLQIDTLTRLYNRKALKTVCAVYFQKAIFENKRIAIGLADLDNFKQLNDNHGHLSGDGALTKISKIMRNLSDVNVQFVRYGGDEFLVLIFDCDAEAVSSIAERLKESIVKLKIKTCSKESVNNFLTISQGYYCAVPQKNETIVSFIKKADEMLYKAKVGKNTIQISCKDI